MSDKTEKFQEMLAPCIEKGDLEACVEEAARLAEEIGISGEELLDLSSEAGSSGSFKFAYVLSLAATQVLEGAQKAIAHNNAGLAANQIGKLENSEDNYKKAIELDPNYATAHNNYANLLGDLGRRDEAEKCYKKAIELDPNYAPAHNNYANLLKDLGRQNVAENHYKKAIELYPKNALAHNNYANLLRELERFSEAEREARTALQIEPANPYALGTLGDILADEEYFQEAEDQYKTALKNSDSMKNSAISEIHNNLGYVYAKLKQYDKAEKKFKKAVKLDSMNVKAVRNLRAIGKSKDRNYEIGSGLPGYQKCFLTVLISILLGVCYYLFLFWEVVGDTKLLSDSMFVAQSSILLALMIFVFFSHQLTRVSFGTQGVELEMSTGKRTVASRSQSAESAPSFER